MIAIILILIILLIAVGFFFDINIGPIAMLLALILGKTAFGLGTGTILGFIPINVLFTVLLISVFYGFAMENGTAQIMISRAVESFSGKPWLISPVIFLVTAIASGSGLGTNVALIMAPIAMQIAIESGIHPLIMAVGVSGGSTIGSNLPFSLGGSVAKSLIEADGLMVNGFPAVMNATLVNAIVQTMTFIVLYFVLKGFRNRGYSRIQTSELTAKQRATVRLIIFVVVLGAIPAIAANIIKSEFLTAFANICDLNFAMLLGIIIAERKHLADVRQVTEKRVPFMLIVIISGMCMMIGVAKEAGVIQMLSDFLAKQGSQTTIVTIAIITAMLMSLFGGAVSIVLPTLFPVATSIILATGIDPAVMYSAIFVGATCGGISPFSSGGMIILSACTDLEIRRKLLVQLIPVPFILALFAVIVFNLITII